MESGCFYNPNPKPTGRCLKDTTSSKVDSKCEKTEIGCKVISLPPLSSTKLPLSPKSSPKSSLPPLSPKSSPKSSLPPLSPKSSLPPLSPKKSQESKGEMGKISGPITAYSLYMDRKSINLFGDAHFSLKGTCTPCQDINLNTLQVNSPSGSEDCYDISVLLSKVFTKASEEKKWVDFYIEIPFIKDYYPERKEIKEGVYQFGYLYKLYYIFYNCMHKLNCRYDTTRFHYVDIRLQYKLLNLPKMTEELENLISMSGMKKPLSYSTIMNTFESYVIEERIEKSLNKFINMITSEKREKIPFLEDTDKLMKDLYFSGGQTMQGRVEPKNYRLLKLYLTSDNFYKDAMELMNLSFIKKQEELLQANYYLTVPTLLVNRRGKNMHRIRAQLEALENEGQGDMAKRIVDFILGKYLKAVDNSKVMELWKSIMITYEGYLNNRFRSLNDINMIIEKIIQEYKKVNELLTTSITGTALLLDAYLLARMFRTYPGKAHIPSSKSIVYAGDAHIKVYVDFFEEMKIPISKYEPNGNKKITDTNTLIRCIDNVDLRDFLIF